MRPKFTREDLREIRSAARALRGERVLWGGGGSEDVILSTGPAEVHVFPDKRGKALTASAAPAAPAAASAPQVQRSAPPQPVSGPTKPVPFNAMPRAAARPAPKPVNEPAKALPQIKPVIPQPSAAVLRSVPRSVLQDAEELAAQPVHLHRVGAKPAPAPPTAANPVPVVEHAALGRLAPKAAPPAPAQTPTSARQLAQEPSAAPVRAETPPATKKPLGRPRKAAVLAPAEVADILQADLPDTRPAAPPVPAQQAIAEVRAAQAQRQPALFEHI